MKQILIVAAAVLPFTSPAFADVIRPSQALADQGQYMVVEGIAHVHDGAGDTEIDVTDSNNGQLAAIIPENAKGAFSQLASYDGKTVDVTGVIQADHGRAIINLTRANQLKLTSP